MKLCKLFGILDPCYIILTDVENFFMDKLNLVILLLPDPVLDFYHFESRMNNSTEEFIQNVQEFSTRSSLDSPGPHGGGAAAKRHGHRGRAR